MSDLDVAEKNILDEDDNAKSEKEQNAMDGAEPLLKMLQIKSPNLP